MNEDYFSWLCSLTGSRSVRRQYQNLLHQLHLKPFRWFVYNDDNRNEDGKELRYEYIGETGTDEPDQLDFDASMLEMLIALSRRASFESYGTPAEWFWKLIENLDLQHYTDANWDRGVEEEVNEALEMVIQRSYSIDGRGGLFPLRMAKNNQKRVELWYQLAAYLLEGEHVANGPPIR